MNTEEKKTTVAPEVSPSARKSILLGVGLVVVAMILLALSGYVFLDRKSVV